MVRVAAVAVAFLALVDGARLSKVKKHGVLSECGAKGGAARNGTSINIVNGDNADQCEWKWQVGLKRYVGGMPYCGGMLINPEWVLTAAHCGNSPGFVVSAGDYEPQRSSSTVQNRLAVQVINHPDYNKQKTRWDFSLVRLDAPMDFDSCVGSVCLPTEGADVSPGAKCWITGWGTLSAGGSQSRVLQEVAVNIISNEDCVTKFGYGATQIDESMLCAQGQTSDGLITDACQGDSGGPLVCESEGTWTLYGATSWGRGCAGANYPGIWARIHTVLGWIDDTLEANQGPPPAPLVCPDFAKSPTPDDDGDCRCKGGKYCSTNGADKNCPVSSGVNGAFGGTYFYADCKDCECIGL